MSSCYKWTVKDQFYNDAAKYYTKLLHNYKHMTTDIINILEGVLVEVFNMYIKVNINLTVVTEKASVKLFK